MHDVDDDVEEDDGEERGYLCVMWQSGSYKTYLVHEDLVVTERIDDVDELGFYIGRLCDGKETYRMQRRSEISGKPPHIFNPPSLSSLLFITEDSNGICLCIFISIILAMFSALRSSHTITATVFTWFYDKQEHLQLISFQDFLKL